MQQRLGASESAPAGWIVASCDLKDTTTRTERLRWSAAEALALLDDAPGTELSTVALAMAEQLQAAAVPLESLDLCIVYWSRALDGLAPGTIPQERLERLDADLSIEAQSSATLALAGCVAVTRSHGGGSGPQHSVVDAVTRALGALDAA